MSSRVTETPSARPGKCRGRAAHVDVGVTPSAGSLFRERGGQDHVLARFARLTSLGVEAAELLLIGRNPYNVDVDRSRGGDCCAGLRSWGCRSAWRKNMTRERSLRTRLAAAAECSVDA